jgi:hypothetical protein
MAAQNTNTKQEVRMKTKALNIIFSNTINVNGVEHETIPSERMVLACIMLNLAEVDGEPFLCTQPEIANSIGVEAKAVGRAVRKLVGIGAVEAVKKKTGWHYYG